MMLVDEALFDLPDGAVVPVVVEPKLSSTRRRTKRQLAELGRRRHPLGGRPLHPDAPAVDDRHGPGPRCGTCTHRLAGHYPKCELGPITNGPGTDLRSWWPGCTSWAAVTDG